MLADMVLPEPIVPPPLAAPPPPELNPDLLGAGEELWTPWALLQLFK